MNILITGGRGFLGKELVKQLSKLKKHRLFIISRNICISNDPDIIYIKADLLKDDLDNIIKKNKIRIVYHLAASSDETLSYDKLYAINAGGTKKILFASIKNKIDHFIYASTVGVLGNNMGSVINPANENFECMPETNYEKTKYLAEQIVIEHKQDIPITIIRPTMIYGLNEKWTKIFKHAKKRFPVIGSGNNIWHLVYVKDAAKSLVLALNNKKAIGQIYIIAGPDYMSYKETYEIMCKYLQTESPKIHIPLWMANIIAFIFETTAGFVKTKPIITRCHIKRLLRDRVFNCTKAKEQLGYIADYNIEKGFKETIDELKKYTTI